MWANTVQVPVSWLVTDTAGRQTWVSLTMNPNRKHTPFTYAGGGGIEHRTPRSLYLRIFMVKRRK